jgi:hypothetical protein
MTFAILNATRAKNRVIETYESRGVAGDPGDEDDLASVIGTGEWNEPP